MTNSLKATEVPLKFIALAVHKIIAIAVLGWGCEDYNDVMYHAFEVCGRRYVPRRGVGAGSGPGVSSAGGIIVTLVLSCTVSEIQRLIG